jgi:hypothetical protein
MDALKGLSADTLLPCAQSSRPSGIMFLLATPALNFISRGGLQVDPRDHSSTDRRQLICLAGQFSWIIYMLLQA